MRLLDQWLNELPPSHSILDLGCGPGSLPIQLSGLKVTGVDVDSKSLAKNPNPTTCAESHNLPFANRSFDLIVCHHTLEHFRDIPGTIREIRRVLKPDGRLFVTVPDGASFSDRLYRLLLCGGGHMQRFRLEDLARDIESGTGLHLAARQDLFTSFLFLDKRNFVPAPLGALPGPLPRRMRWLGTLPSWSFAFARLFLNLATRAADGCFATRFSLYGWALAFGPEEVSPQIEPGSWNVCMSCGAGFDEPPAKRFAWLLYRCPYCSAVNYRFPNRPI
jgi:SAM-dependent methyltransferase